MSRENTRLMSKVAGMPTWQKVALGVAVVATGGVAAYGIAQGGLIVAAGEVLVVAGPAAKVLAEKV